MISEKELLQYIHDTAEMGVEGISTIVDYARNSEMHKVLCTQMEEYRNLERKAEKLMHVYGAEAKDVVVMA